MAMDVQEFAPVTQRVVRNVRRQVVAGKLKAGMQLPAVRTLAESSRVGVMTAHKVLQRIEAEGWAERRGRRLYVAEDAVRIAEERLREDHPVVIHCLDSTLVRMGAEFELRELNQGFSQVFPHSSFRHVYLDVKAGSRAVEQLLRESKESPYEMGFLLRNMPAAFKRLFAMSQLPCVVEGYVKPEISLPCVYEDMAAVGRTVAELLSRTGRVVAFCSEELVGGELFLVDGLRQFLQGHEDCRPSAEEFYFRLPQAMDDHLRLIDHLLGSDRCPGGIFIVHPEYALPTVRLAAEHGLRIPEDLQIIGLCHHPFYEYANPSVTSIGVASLMDLGRRCAGLLAHAMAGGNGEVPREVVETTLIERGSTLPRHGLSAMSGLEAVAGG